MLIRMDIGWLTAALLLSARVGAALAFTPVLGPLRMPALLRAVLIVGLTAALASTIPAPEKALTSLAELLAACLGELFIGASLAFGFMAAYAATQVAGRVLDVQMGFGAANVLNPATQTVAPLIGNLLGMVAVVLFLSMDGHHVLLKALAASVAAFPPGSLLYTLDWQAFFLHSGIMFVFGLALAAPVMFVLLLADVAMAVFARSMPQLNIFVLSFSVKIVLGLLVLMASMPFALGVLEALFARSFEYWARVASGT